MFETKMIPIEDLYESDLNPRHEFELQELESLGASMLQMKQLQPLLVRPGTGKMEGKYEILDGARRFRAAKLIRLQELLCSIIVCEERDAQVIIMISNLQRVNLNPIEEARAIGHLVSIGWKQKEIAEHIGKSQPWVNQRLKLNALPDSVQDLMSNGTILPVHATMFDRIAEYPEAVEMTMKDIAEHQKDSDKQIEADELEDIIDVTIRELFFDVDDPARSCNEDDAVSYDRDTWSHFDDKPCEKCPTTVKIKGYSGTETTYCTNRDCFKQHRDAAIKKYEEIQTKIKERLEKKMAKAKECNGSDKPVTLTKKDFSQIDYNAREKLTWAKFNKKDCAKCEKNVKVEGDNDKYCLDKDCFSAKAKAYEREERIKIKEHQARMTDALNAYMSKAGTDLWCLEDLTADAKKQLDRMFHLIVIQLHNDAKVKALKSMGIPIKMNQQKTYDEVDKKMSSLSPSQQVVMLLRISFCNSYPTMSNMNGFGHNKQTEAFYKDVMKLMKAEPAKKPKSAKKSKKKDDVEAPLTEKQLKKKALDKDLSETGTDIDDAEDGEDDGE